MSKTETVGNAPLHTSDAFVADLQQKMLLDKERLEEQLDHGEINAEDFANQVNGLLNSVLKQAAHIIPTEDFERIFGFKYSGQTAVLVDPQLAAASAKSSNGSN